MNKFLSAILLITLAGVSMNGLADDDDENEEDDERKVVLCHKGKNSISVGKPGLSAHLAHGDIEGYCTDRGERPPYSNGDAAVVTMQCEAFEGEMVVGAFSSSVIFLDPPLSDIGSGSEPDCAEALAALLKEGFHVRSVTGDTDYLLLGETDDDS
jgi:hypothetical protein